MNPADPAIFYRFSVDLQSQATRKPPLPQHPRLQADAAPVGCAIFSNPMKRYPFILLLLLFLISSCSTLQSLVGYKHPEIHYRDVSVESLSLDNIELMFHFDIDNPNRVGVKLEEYKYDLLINDRDFLSGAHREQLEIASRSSGIIGLPLTLSFREIYESVSSVAQADSFSYLLKTEVGVDIPVYGKTMIPIEVVGSLPRLRMPEVSFSGFDVHSLSFSGVDMTLTIHVSNPNPLGMSLSDLNVAASISGNPLADLRLHDLRVGSGENIAVPVRFNMGLAGLGSTLLDMLRGNQSFEYEIKGDGLVGLDHPAFREMKRLPFHLFGEYRIGD